MYGCFCLYKLYFLSALALLCSEMTKTPGTTPIQTWEAQVKPRNTILSNYWAPFEACETRKMSQCQFIMSMLFPILRRSILTTWNVETTWNMVRIELCHLNFSPLLISLLCRCLSLPLSCPADEVSSSPSNIQRQPSLLGDYPSDYRKTHMSLSLSS